MSQDGPAAESDGGVAAESPKISTELFRTAAESTTRDESAGRTRVVSRRAVVALVVGADAELEDVAIRAPLSGLAAWEAGIAAPVRSGTG